MNSPTWRRRCIPGVNSFSRRWLTEGTWSRDASTTTFRVKIVSFRCNALHSLITASRSSLHNHLRRRLALLNSWTCVVFGSGRRSKMDKHSPGEGTELSILLLGDVMLGRLVDRQLSSIEGSDEYIWGDFLPILQKTDQIVAANLETSVCHHQKLPKMPGRAFNFAVTPQNMQKALSKANASFVSLANNHVLDFQEKGLLETLQTLRAHGIHFAGAGETLQEARKPAVITRNGVNVAFLSLADHPAEWKADTNSPGINFIDPTAYDINVLSNQIRSARKEVDDLGGGIVVVFIHWGPNWQWRPSKSIVNLGHDMVHCGADVVFGHSSHHIMGIEIYEGKPIIYGAGSFIDDYALDEHYRNDLGFLYDLQVHHGRPTSLDLYPSMVRHTWRRPLSEPPYMSTVEKAGEQEAKWLRKKLMELCGEFGTKVASDDLTCFSIAIPAHPGFCSHGNISPQRKSS